MMLSIAAVQSAPGLGSAHGLIRPSREELAAVYGSFARLAVAEGSAKLLDAPPEGWDSSQRFDITPEGRIDFYEAVHVIRGRMYLHQIGEGFPGRWYVCGRVPCF